MTFSYLIMILLRSYVSFVRGCRRRLGEGIAVPRLCKRKFYLEKTRKKTIFAKSLRLWQN